MGRKFLEEQLKNEGNEDEGYGYWKWEQEQKTPLVKIPEWEKNIEDAYTMLEVYYHELLGANIAWNQPCNKVERFLTMIWNMSLVAFDQPREVQVAIDSNDRLFIDVGTPGYVEFKTPPVGMKLPIQCWIHTHPFGDAYFSGTDWKTIDTWSTLMHNAIVLGDNEYWAYNVQKEIVKQVNYGKMVSPASMDRKLLRTEEE